MHSRMIKTLRKAVATENDKALTFDPIALPSSDLPWMVARVHRR